MIRSNRSRFTACGTWPAISAAGVPSSGEYSKTPSRSKRCSSTKRSRSSKSASVSPGRPTMSEVRSASPGTRARSRASRARRNTESRPRFIARSSRSELCWSGMSRYFTIFGSEAIASTSASGHVARVRVVEPDPADRRPPCRARAGGGGAGPWSPGEILAVGGQVLRDERELEGALRRERGRLGDDVVDGPRALGAAELRDDAERAGVVAALRDLDVGGVRRERVHPRASRPSGRSPGRARRAASTARPRRPGRSRRTRRCRGSGPPPEARARARRRGAARGSRSRRASCSGPPPSSRRARRSRRPTPPWRSR